MKLSELIHDVWKDPRVRALRIRKSEVKVVLNVTIEHIRDGLLKDKFVKLQGLFTVELDKVKGRKIQNIHTKEYDYSKDHIRARVSPSKELQDGMDNLHDE